MLILTRRIGETFYVGDEVRVTVLGVRGTQVRIGIHAPKDVAVHREEIYYKIKHERGSVMSLHKGDTGRPRAGNVADAVHEPDYSAEYGSSDEPDPNNS